MKMNLKKPLLWIFVLILLAEAMYSVPVLITSKRSAKQMANVAHAPKAAEIRGVTLYDSGMSAIVDEQLLTLLSDMHSRQENAVRLPVDFAGHMVGSALDGGWLGQIATLMEMVYQSNYHLILTNASGYSYTAAQYADLWRQIDAAYGHRPARELWYELHVPVNADIDEWEQMIKKLAFDIWSNNPQREIVTMIDGEADEALSEKIVSLVLEIGAHLGIRVDQPMEIEELTALNQRFVASGDSIVLIGAESIGYADEMNGWIMDVAEKENMSYLIYGN